MATPTERPEISINGRVKYRENQIAVSSNGHTTANSANGPGFYPNALGKRNYILKRAVEEAEKMQRVGKSTAGMGDGWVGVAGVPGPGGKGLLVNKTLNGSDGYGIEVTIPEPKDGFLDFGEFQVEVNYINEVFAFYTRISTPNLPLMNTRKEGQEGGFYPSVYGGISGAKMLTPLIARQMMRMYEQVGYNRTIGETNTRKTRKRKSKKLSRNKRA